MRLLQIGIPVGEREAVVAVLEDEEVEFSIVDEASEAYSAVAFAPVREEVVEELLEALRAVRIHRHGYVAVVELEAILSDTFERTSATREAESRTGISEEELDARARELVESPLDYVVLIVVSAIVATAGILMANTAVVVGSMVIAPLVGPSLAASVGTVLEDRDLFRTGVRFQVLGLALAVASATGFAIVARHVLQPGTDIRLIGQISSWVPPGALSLIIALGSGIAGGFALTSSTSATLVGVMIAAALIPPAATIGLGVAYADPAVAVGASVLLLANVLSINLTSLGVLWWQGFRPRLSLREADARRSTLKRAALLLVGVAVVSSVSVAATVDANRNAAFERDVERVLNEDDVRVLSIEVSYTTELFFRKPDAVTVRIADGVPPDEEKLRQELRDETGRDVEVMLIVENARFTGDRSTFDAARAATPPEPRAIGDRPRRSFPRRTP